MVNIFKLAVFSIGYKQLTQVGDFQVAMGGGFWVAIREY